MRSVVARFVLAALSAGLFMGGCAPRQLRAGETQAPSTRAKNYDLASLEIFRKVIVQIKDNYVEPERIHPKEMFVSALYAVEKQVAEVMVEGSGCEGGRMLLSVRDLAACGRVKVTVGSASREFDFRGLDTIWSIPLKVREVFFFLRDNLLTHQDQQEIEYAAINGMLNTLDPHSWLLKPDIYKEMRVQSRSQFGSVGLVFSIRHEKLTVMRVLKGGPADRAGVKARDVITQIDNDRTDNMELQEAIDRLRGLPGSNISIYVQQGKETEPRKLDLIRAALAFDPVAAKLLDQGVGYVRLLSFSGGAARDIQAAILQMKQQNGGSLKGLVLDLRGNPGGLLEQAIRVADLFVEEGTIVTTVGIAGQLREPKQAHNDGNEREFPMAVLIDARSAAASEIVAGALKNLNRAVIVGQRSFGNGLVQVLYDFKDKESGEESALKLTIAQYLIPGDISIQGVGIVPDIELLPARVLQDRLHLFAPQKSDREAELEKNLARGAPIAGAAPDRATAVPAETLRYLREENDEAEASEDDGRIIDYQAEFCRDLLLAVPSTDRREQRAKIPPFVREHRQVEQEKISKKLESLGLNWSPAEPSQGEPKVVAELATNSASAGETLEMKLTAENVGTAPVFQLRAYTESDNSILDRREFAFGLLKPGEKRTWVVPVKVPRYLPSRRDDVRVKWSVDGGRAPEDLTVATNIIGLPRPAFGSTYQIVPSDPRAQVDGMLHPGETFEVILDVKNVGDGPAYDAFAVMRNSSEGKFTVKRGRTRLGPMKPGETKTTSFLITVGESIEAGKIEAMFELGDRDLLEIQKQKINLTVAPPMSNQPSVPAVEVMAENAAVLNAALPDAERLAQPGKSQVLAARGRVGAFYRVEWQKGRYGFIAADQVKESTGAATETETAEILQREPPRIDVANLDTSQGGISIDSDHLTLAGVASAASGLRDLQIFVQHDNDYRKAFFGTARRPGEQRPGMRLEFSTDLMLKPGSNTIYVIAIGEDDLQTQKTLVVYRRAGPG